MYNSFVGATLLTIRGMALQHALSKFVMEGWTCKHGSDELFKISVLGFGVG